MKVDVTQVVTDLYGEPVTWGGDTLKVHRAAAGAVRLVKDKVISADDAIQQLGTLLAEPLTLDRACVTALQAEIEEAERKDFKAILERTDLAREIVAAAKSGIPIELDSAKIQMIKTRLPRVHAPIVATAVAEMIEPREKA